MGITSLLKHLGPISESTKLSKLSGKTFAVDGYSWLHKSIFTCPEELCTNKPTTAYLKYFQQRYENLKKLDIHLYMVFDGHPLGAKMSTNLGRKEEREYNKVLAEGFILKGDVLKARDHYARACPVTSHMAKSWINFCSKNGIPYIVAPFEADSQMVYLEKIGLVDGIISEDSDLLIFGCETLVTKLDLTTSSCVVIKKKDFPLMDHDLDKKGNPKFPVGRLSQTDLYNLVCLSGCDYTPGIRLIGLLKAVRLLQEYNFDLELAIKSVEITHKQKLMKKKDIPNPIPKNYLEDITRAKICFAYMFVFDPLKEKITTLNPLPKDPLSISQKFFEYMGPLVTKNGEREIISALHEIDHNIHKLISLGELNQMTLEKLFDRETQLTLDYRNHIAEIKKQARSEYPDNDLSPITRMETMEDLLKSYESKNLQFILPLTRSKTVDNFCNKKLEKMVEDRKLIRAAVDEIKVLRATSANNEYESKFFKNRKVRQDVETLETISKSQPLASHDEKIPEIDSCDENDNVKEISFTNPNHLFIDFSEQKSENEDVSTTNNLNKKFSPMNSCDPDFDDNLNATIGNKSEILENINKFSYVDDESFNKSGILNSEIQKSTFKTTYYEQRSSGILEGKMIKSPEKKSQTSGISQATSSIKSKHKNILLGLETNSLSCNKKTTRTMKRDFSSTREPIEYISYDTENPMKKVESENISGLLKKFEYKEELETTQPLLNAPRLITPLKKGSRSLARSAASRNLGGDSKKLLNQIDYPKNSFFIRANKK
ncbi:hypothetical protein QEN19_003404 [Hanseniaspora menglaensis]